MRAVAGAILILLLGGGLASAQTRPPSLEQQADETARAVRDALERAMRLMDGVLGSIPQYQLPEVLPNGDIIIRRLPSKPADPPTRRQAPPVPNKSPSDPKQEET